MNYVVLGKNIAERRRAKNLTQEQLAEIIDVSTVFVSQIETAVRKPSLETMYRLSQALDVTIDSLIDSSNTIAVENNISNLLKNKTDEEIKLIFKIIYDVCSYTKSNR